MKHLLTQLKYFSCIVFIIVTVLLLSHFFPIPNERIDLDKPLRISDQAVLCGDVDTSIITTYGEDPTAIILCH